MITRTRWIAGLILMACLYTQGVLALAPMGPPRALIGAGRFAFGVDYTHQTMDLQTFGTYKERYLIGSSYQWYCKYNEFEIKDFKSNLVFGQIGYGLCDTWDVFGRIGVSDASGNASATALDGDGLAPTLFLLGGEEFALDSGFSMAWGMGSRATFCENGDLSWGGVFQVTFLDPKTSQSRWTDPVYPGVYVAADIDTQIWEIQAALGPTFNFGGFWLYGGPFLHIVRGDMDIAGTWADYDQNGPIVADHRIRKDSWFGGYAGAQWLMTDSLSWHLEGQFTGGAWGVGMGGTLKME